MTVQPKGKVWRGRCAYCEHYEINHGTPCNSSDRYGKCNCKKWVEVYNE